MKKNYIAPEVEVLLVVHESALLAPSDPKIPEDEDYTGGKLDGPGDGPADDNVGAKPGVFTPWDWNGQETE